MISIAAGCMWDKADAPVPIPPPPPTECDTTNITYDSTIVPILQSNCYGCHNSSIASGGINLTTYSGVLAVVNSGQLWGSVNFNSGYTGMPYNGNKLSDCDISQIGIWINAGAPGSDDTSITNLKDSICYENEIQPILNTYCAKSGCHDAITHEEGYNLSDYSDVMSLVKAGNPGDSKLIKVMKKSDPEDRMPPSGNAQLTSDQIALMEQWILEGALTGIDCNVSDCDTANVTYSGTVMPILQAYCYGCHSSPNGSGGIILTSYNDVVTLVNNGKLWGSINFLSGYIGMPYNGNKMSDCNLAKIRIWIDSGAINN